MSIQPTAGQPVYDTRNGREGILVAVPSPYSPFVRVQWIVGPHAQPKETTESLEHLAYRPYGFQFEPTDEMRRRLPTTKEIA